MQIIVCSDRKIKYFFSYNQYYGQKKPPQDTWSQWRLIMKLIVASVIFALRRQGMCGR